MFKLATKDTKMHYQAKELADYEKIITMDYNRKPVVYNVSFEISIQIYNVELDSNDLPNIEHRLHSLREGRY